jgi:anti-sigma factor RsiW
MNCKDARHAAVLDHYGELEEGDRGRLEAHLRECPACATDRAETRRILTLVSERSPAAVPGLDAERSWRRIQAGIRSAAPAKRSGFAPGLRWGLAGAGLALVLAAGILIGRFGLKPGMPGLTASAGPAAAAVSAGSATVLPAAALQPVLAGHLDDLRPVLLDFANSVSEARPGAAVSVDERLLRGLMLQNLLLRRALNGHDPAATELLDDLDLVLKEIVNAKSPGGATTAQVRGLIKDRGILFRMQVLKTT